MSSSLFYDCYAPYESYPTTIHVEGDKSFGELHNGDVLYILIYDVDRYYFDELNVVYSWHKTRGNNYISCLRGKKKFNINFGPANCWNVDFDSKSNSIVLYNGKIIGTSKKSIYEYVHKNMNEELKEIEIQYNNQLSIIKSLEKIIL